MQNSKLKTQTRAGRFCMGWQCTCFGFLCGFAVCLVLLDKGYERTSLDLRFQMLLMPIGFVATATPKAILEITRLIHRHRELSRQN
jgi:hypothetical protein